MKTDKDFTFGEKTQEDGLPVWQSPKYKDAKQKAIETIQSGLYGLTEADFWILMNKNKDKTKMIYSGLILSHNGCLKINDALPEEKKYKPSSISKFTENGVKNSLVLVYNNEEQGVYEFGEVSSENCKNAYPYAMVLKRLLDRVILKNCKFAFSGIYSECESDEFNNKNDPEEPQGNNYNPFEVISEAESLELQSFATQKWGKDAAVKIKPILSRYHAEKTKDVRRIDYGNVWSEIENAD